MQKQRKAQGDPKLAEAQETEKGAAVTLPPIEELLKAAEQALAQKVNPNNPHAGKVCPLCCEEDCRWPARASQQHWEEACRNSQCYTPDGTYKRC